MKSAYSDNVREAKILTNEEKLLAKTLVNQEHLDKAKDFAPYLLAEANSDNLESQIQIIFERVSPKVVLLTIGNDNIISVRFEGKDEKEKDLAVRYILEEVKDSFAEEMLARYMAHFQVSREEAKKDFQDDMERLYFQDGVTSELELGANLFKAIVDY